VVLAGAEGGAYCTFQPHLRPTPGSREGCCMANRQAGKQAGGKACQQARRKKQRHSSTHAEEMAGNREAERWCCCQVSR
jgi:hypothetical protein